MLSQVRICVMDFLFHLKQSNVVCHQFPLTLEAVQRSVSSIYLLICSSFTWDTLCHEFTFPSAPVPHIYPSYFFIFLNLLCYIFAHFQLKIKAVTVSVADIVSLLTNSSCCWSMDTSHESARFFVFFKSVPKMVRFSLRKD